MAELHESIRAFVDDPDVPTLADLPARWDAVSAAPLGTMPDSGRRFTRRDLLLWYYAPWARSRRWAWDGMQALARHLMDRGEDLPEHLLRWACLVATDRLPRPRSRANEDRDNRFWRVLHQLRSAGYTREAAIAAIAEAMSMPEATVRSALEKEASARPDPNNRA